MRAVAGADEAGNTPQAPEQTARTPETASAAERASAQTSAETPAEQAPEAAQPHAPGFAERGRMRRRARFLRKARELAYRDLGGLVFDLHRFGQRNDQLVLAKLATLRQIDTEVRELEAVLGERRQVTVLREVGIAACPRCAAIHGSDDRFCPSCGLAFDTHADRPLSTAPVSPQPYVPAPAAQPATETPAQRPAPRDAQRQQPAHRPRAAQQPVASTAPPVRAPAPATGEDEPTQVIRPPAANA